MIPESVHGGRHVLQGFVFCETHGRWLAVDRDGRLVGKCDECAREYAEKLKEIRAAA